MAAITPAIGGTFKSATVEGLIHEICAFLQNAEANPAKNPGAVDNITGSHNQNSGRYECSYTLPVSQQLAPGGGVKYAATEYLTNLNFVPGIGGTFEGTTAAGILLDAIIHAQLLESDPVKNPDNQNYVNGRINIEGATATGTIELPVTATINDAGEIVYAVQPYLLA